MFAKLYKTGVAPEATAPTSLTVAQQTTITQVIKAQIDADTGVGVQAGDVVRAVRAELTGLAKPIHMTTRALRERIENVYREEYYVAPPEPEPEPVIEKPVIEIEPVVEK